MKSLGELAESATKLTTMHFALIFTFGTIFLTVMAASLLYFIVDAFDKAGALAEPKGIVIICLFLILWVVVMIITATIIFTLGGKLIRYDLSENRLDSLTEKGGPIDKAQKRVWLIGLSLLPFANEGLLNNFERKIQKGVEVRLLIFDPTTEFAIERESSIDSIQNKLSHDIQEAVSKFKARKYKLDQEHPTLANNFQIRLYKKNASMSCFILDDEARIGLYMEGGTGLSAPEIRVTKRDADKDFFEKIEKNFESIWNSSTEA